VDTLGCAHDVAVFDDASQEPVLRQLDTQTSGLIRVLRDDAGVGYIAGRNRIVTAAAHDYVLLLDDDTIVLDRGAVGQAVAVLDADPSVAAIAFAQAEADGRPWDARMQPGRGEAPCYVPSFIGFAHMLRRDVFLSLGGYRISFVFYGEEKDYCVRLLGAGHHVVYLPQARIAHVPDAIGRDARRYVRHAIRNDCLTSLYNEPWPLVAVGLPLRLLRFRRMAAGIPGGDPEGLGWVVSTLWHARGDIRRQRRPVPWSIVREWRRRSKRVVRYEGTAA
jgi:GT2 family glycosyltransferase